MATAQRGLTAQQEPGGVERGGIQLPGHGGDVLVIRVEEGIPVRHRRARPAVLCEETISRSLSFRRETCV